MSKPARARSRRSHSLVGTPWATASCLRRGRSGQSKAEVVSEFFQRATCSFGFEWVCVHDMQQAARLDEAGFLLSSRDLVANVATARQIGNVGDHLMDHRQVHPAAWPVAPGPVACRGKPEDLAVSLCLFNQCGLAAAEPGQHAATASGLIGVIVVNAGRRGRRALARRTA